MLTVAIAVEPPAQFADGARAVSESCEEVLGRGRCTVEAELAPERVVTWHALIVKDELDSSNWRVEFRDRSRDGVLIESRAITFSALDTLETRWASLGTIVAAMVTARDAEVRPLPKPVPCKPCRPAPVIVPEPKRRSELDWGADLAALSGPGLEDGAYRFGGLTRVHVASSLIPGAIGLASLRYAERPGQNLELTWWSVSAGIGARIEDARRQFGAELTGELVFERMLMRANSDTDARSDSTSQNRLGGRLGLNGMWAAWRPLTVLIGTEASVLRPSVHVHVGDRVVGRAPLFGFAFSFGFRLMLY